MGQRAEGAGEVGTTGRVQGAAYLHETSSGATRATAAAARMTAAALGEGG